jgi:hypothetical protein
MRNVIRIQLRRPESTYAKRFPERHHPRQLLVWYSGEIDRTGLKILENNKNIQSPLIQIFY